MGAEKGETKIVVSRFPADSGILAEEREKGLSVEFLETNLHEERHIL